MEKQNSLFARLPFVQGITLKRVNAILLLLAVALVWLGETLLTRMGLWRVVITILAQPFKKLRPYAFNMWVVSDQYVNTYFGGNPDHTISGRIGVNAMRGREGYMLAEKIVDGLFYLVIRQENHCRKSIEPDEKE
jgi:hypothetical protein